MVLGTAGQAPTRCRNHNGYLLRWDGHHILFDPGEGTQRQLVLAGLSGADVHRICLTHFHADHCFGLPGVLARMALDEPDGCSPNAWRRWAPRAPSAPSARAWSTTATWRSTVPPSPSRT